MANEETSEVTIISSSENLGAIVKSELDQAIATAKNYPRDLDKSINRAIAMATRNLDIAEACQYSLPVDGKTIKGKSVRLAEIMASTYQNIKVAGRVLGNDGRFVTVEAICFDTENNIVMSMPVVRSIRTKEGKMYSNHQQQVTIQAALAIAKRNVIFGVIPASLVDEVAEAARAVVKGTPAELPVRRAKALDFFMTNFKVDETRILQKLNKQSIHQIDADDIVTLVGFKNAIESNEASVDDIFPSAANTEVNEKQKAATSALKSTSDKISNQASKSKLQKLEFGKYKLVSTQDCKVPDVEGTMTPFMNGDEAIPGSTGGVYSAGESYFSESKLVEAGFERSAL